MERPAERSTLTNGTLIAGEPTARDPLLAFERTVQAQSRPGERRRTLIVGGFFLVLAALASLTGVATLGARLTLTALGLLELTLGWRDPPPDRSQGVSYLRATAESALITLILYLAAPAFAEPVEVLLLPGVLAWTALTILSTSKLDPWLSLYQGVTAAAGYALLAVMFTPLDSELLPYVLVGPPRHFAEVLLLLVNGVCAAGISSGHLAAASESFGTQREADDLLVLFGHANSLEAARRMSEELGVDGTEPRDVTVLSLEIRAFREWAEGVSGVQVLGRVEQVQRAATAAINRNHGLVYRIRGDTMAAVFAGGGNDAQNALNASFELCEALSRLQDSGVVPPLRIGLGLDRGRATVGSVTLAERPEWVVLGDVLAIASRLCRFNEDYDSQILITEAVWALTHAARAGAAPLDQVRVRGIPGMFTIYRVL